MRTGLFPVVALLSDEPPQPRLTPRSVSVTARAKEIFRMTRRPNEVNNNERIARRGKYGTMKMCVKNLTRPLQKKGLPLQSFSLLNI